MPPSPLALATVTSPAFLPGTIVLLDSFLRHHPGFTGELVVFHEALPPPMQAILAAFPRLRLHPISDALSARLDDLTRAVPRLQRRRARFFSLETFRLKDYERVLFCDSDVFFRAGVDELFALEPELIGCGEQTYYTGEGRDRRTYAVRPAPERKPAACLQGPFNAGFLLVRQTLLRDDVYAGLLGHLDPGAWQLPELKHTDQFVLNRYFEGRLHFVDPVYNYLLPYADAIRRACGRTLAEARVLHFNGRPKPWEPTPPAGPDADERGAAVQEWRRAFDAARASGRW